MPSNHQCRRREPGSNCGGDNQCDSSGNCVPSCGKVGQRCCSNDRCDNAFSDPGKICRAKLADGEACSEIGNDECRNECLGYCDPVHPGAPSRCLRNGECADPVTGATAICLDDSPECASR